MCASVHAAFAFVLVCAVLLHHHHHPHHQRDANGHAYYEFEYTAKNSRYTRHSLAVVVVNDGELSGWQTARGVVLWCCSTGCI